MSDLRGLELDWLDVFAEAPLAGNPLAVVHGAGALDGAAMQRIARETNLSETTFVCGAAPRDGAFDVRIFTPREELPFAGHPTLGTAFALRARHAPNARELALRLRIGIVGVRFEDDGRVWLEAPKIALGKELERARVAAALGLRETDLDPKLPPQLVSAGIEFPILPLASLEALERARPIAALDSLGLYPIARGSRTGEDWTVRLFAPGSGIAEDPATGSAAALLGAYLVHHRAHGEARIDVSLSQGTQIGRPSRLFVRAEPGSVRVGGRVVPFLTGTLR